MIGKLSFFAAGSDWLSASSHSAILAKRSYLIYVIIVMQFYAALRLNSKCPVVHLCRVFEHPGLKN